MIGGNALLRKIGEHFSGATRRVAFPFTRIAVPSALFADLSEEDREEAFAKILDLDVGTLRSTSNRLFLRFELIVPGSGEDANPVPVRGETWIGVLTQATSRSAGAPPMTPPVVHFYGFKGGQGRTTLLAFLAHELARDGFRVLVVDLDAEAPSLDLLLGVREVSPEESLVGLRAELAVKPRVVEVPAGGGSVALLGFRPSSEDYDLDAAALSFEAGISSPSQEDLAAQFRQKIAPSYDIILVDHRTGLAPTVPVWVRAMPGPIVVLDRLDGQSRRARQVVGSLWQGLGSPGVLVSYVPPNEAPQTFRDRTSGEAWGWLDSLARAKSSMFPEGQEPLGAEDIDDHWVLWPDDNAFRRRGLPQRDEVGGATRESAQRLREVLDLTGRREHVERPRKLHSSGATDEGLLIATDALRKLCEPGSPYRFIIGRKGTGKTRLLRALAERGIGEPLVVALDQKGDSGLPTSQLTLRALVEQAVKTGSHENFWWTILAAAMESPSTETKRLESSLQDGPELDQGIPRVRQALRNDGSPRVFLIDGLETLSDYKNARIFIEALLRVASTLEHDAVFRSRVSLRIFLRTDITAWGFQNFEQQADGKRIDLQWSTQTILNFVLARLPHLEWFVKSFSGVLEEVRSLSNRLVDGAVSEPECMELLLRIFPKKLGRLNLNTATFLRTYFSDDPQGRESYYPRVYDTFLASINQAGLAGAKLVGKRLDQNTILQAHDEASKAFLQQVRQELVYLVPLDDGSLDRLLSALNGRRTPFVPDVLGKELRIALKLKKVEVDNTLDAMKRIGIFEVHPSLPGNWRVGRLFKSALGMIYARGQERTSA